ncbi:DUF4190 domain-containing protein [Nocardioides mangrovi]|uniref:DUF4190 domain-containing protein n=1 Tax=Nocardioides mangrovi TaxID=2874580 RepID=A0ABS7U7Z5_9ACTN|nr:DUF4190 domain-containing protein [Nocardioides mangrovi]MBZ5736851.1 DUF4190 domain-containing protein [Nocardioides mangrovi]
MSYSEPPPPPPQYGAPVPPAGGMPPKNSGKAITSLVTGIVSLPMVCCWPLGVVLGILGIVFGVLARKDIATSSGALKGAGMALAGIICGAVALALIVIVLILAASGAIDTDFEYSS